MDYNALRQKVIDSTEKAIEELIKIIEEEVVMDDIALTDEEKTFENIAKKNALTADKLKSAAEGKKVAMFNCFDMLDRAEKEQEKIDSASGVSSKKEKEENKGGFAERYAR